MSEARAIVGWCHESKQFRTRSEAETLRMTLEERYPDKADPEVFASASGELFTVTYFSPVLSKVEVRP